jgi:uncharacterized membrane protein YdbT with pleckstrin-like domain
MSEVSQEQTLFKGSSSPLMNLGTFVVCGLVILAAVALAFIIPNLPAWARFGLIGVAALAFLYGLSKWLLIKVRVYEVTTERIRISNGLLTRRTDELELYRVKDTTLVEPFFLRLFSLGDIEVATHDVTTPVVRLQAINGASAVREEMRKSIEACREKKRVRLAELE